MTMLSEDAEFTVHVNREGQYVEVAVSAIEPGEEEGVMMSVALDVEQAHNFVNAIKETIQEILLSPHKKVH